MTIVHIILLQFLKLCYNNPILSKRLRKIMILKNVPRTTWLGAMRQRRDLRP
jgi:hypothetical protein